MKGLMVGLTTTVCIYRILAFKELFANHRSYNRYLPETVLATLREPVTPETDGQTDEVLLPESFVDEVTEVAVSQSAGVTNQPNTTILQNRDIPLPNAADVFRDGIKARLTEAGALNRGEIWVFDLTRSSVTGDAAVPRATGSMLWSRT